MFFPAFSLRASEFWLVHKQADLGMVRQYAWVSLTLRVDPC